MDSFEYLLFALTSYPLYLLVLFWKIHRRAVSYKWFERLFQVWQRMHRRYQFDIYQLLPVQQARRGKINI